MPTKTSKYLYQLWYHGWEETFLEDTYRSYRRAEKRKLEFGERYKDKLAIVRVERDNPSIPGVRID